MEVGIGEAGYKRFTAQINDFLVLIVFRQRITGESNFPLFFNQIPMDGVVRITGNNGPLENVHLHHTRHTFATQMLKSGARLETVKEWLGHEDIKTTEIYAKILQETLIEEGRKFAY